MFWPPHGSSYLALELLLKAPLWCSQGMCSLTRGQVIIAAGSVLPGGVLAVDTQPTQDLWTAVPTEQQHFWSREETLLGSRLVLTWACWGWSSQAPSVSEEAKVLLSRGLTYSHSELPPGAVSLATSHRSNIINFTSLSPVVPSSEPAHKWGQAAPQLPVRLHAKLPLSRESVLGGPVFFSFPHHSPHPPSPPIANAQKRQRSPFLEQDMKTSNPPFTFPSFQILTEITGDFFSPLPTPLTALRQNYSALWSITRYTM